MKRNKLKISKGGISQSAAIVCGIITALLLSVILSVLIVNLVLQGSMRENIISGVVFVIRTISVLSGALICGILLKRDYLKLTGIIAVGYLIILIGMGIVFFDGSFKNFVTGAISVLIGAVVAVLILLRPKGNRYKHKKLAL